MGQSKEDAKAAAKAAKKAAKAEVKRQKKLGELEGEAETEAPVSETATDMRNGAAFPPAGESAPVPSPVAPTDLGDAKAAADRTSAGMTPAERSAAAAERQVRLQRLRVWLAMLTFLVMIISVLWAIKPWKDAERPGTQPTETPSTQPGSVTLSAELIRAPSVSAGSSWTDRWSSDPLTGGTPMLPSARGSDPVPDAGDVTRHFAVS